MNSPQISALITSGNYVQGLFLILLLLSTGCTTFHRDWTQAKSKVPTETKSIEGAWDGKWVSDVNGHNGRLRCIIEQTQPHQYTARYRANYWGILRFGYSVPLELKSKTNGYVFTGEANLGKLAGGTYSYELKASPISIESTYKSNYDHGRFILQRAHP